MFCTRCGFQMEDSDLYCAKCGKPTRPDLAPPAQGRRGLSRPVEGKKIAGVCAGFARYMGVDVTLMRVIWLAALFITGGIMGIVYLCAWFVMPRDVEAPAVQAGAVAEQRVQPQG